MGMQLGQDPALGRQLDVDGPHEPPGMQQEGSLPWDRGKGDLGPLGLPGEPPHGGVPWNIHTPGAHRQLGKHRLGGFCAAGEEAGVVSVGPKSITQGPWAARPLSRALNTGVKEG